VNGPIGQAHQRGEKIIFNRSGSAPSIGSKRGTRCGGTRRNPSEQHTKPKPSQKGKTLIERQKGTTYIQRALVRRDLSRKEELTHVKKKEENRKEWGGKD